MSYLEQGEEVINKFNYMLANAEKVVFLTGAGVSQSAGIGTFAEQEKQLKDVSRFELFSIYAFLDDPVKFWLNWHKFYFNKITQIAEPTFFHKTVKELESIKDVTVVTQNTDGLHSKAGSAKVFEVHGNASRLICMKLRGKGCGKTYHYKDFLPSESNLTESFVPTCSDCGNVLKPDVSLFGEGVSYLSEAREAILDSDLLVIVGTRLQIGPVNELPFLLFGKDDKKVVWANLEKVEDEIYDWFDMNISISADEFARQYLSNAIVGK